MIQACLDSGAYIYLEKPPVPLLHQLDHLIKADTLGRVAVGFQWIGSLWVQQLKTWITEGRFGDVLSIRACGCWPRPDSYYERAEWVGKMTYKGEPTFDGPATNALAHLVHNIMYLGGNGDGAYAEPVTVQGELYRARPIESYDVASLRGELSSGTRFYGIFAHASRTAIPYQFAVTGTKGWLRISNDGRRCESSFGDMEFAEGVVELLHKSYLSFVDYVTGKRSRPLSTLADTRGYLLATNGMLASSGGIHTIGSPWVSRSSDQGDCYYEVDDLSEIIARAYQYEQLPSELELPWAVTTPKLTVDTLRKSDAAMMDHFFENGQHEPVNGKAPVNGAHGEVSRSDSLLGVK
jgi:hypothetical protein